MDSDVCRPQKIIKLNHPLIHLYQNPTIWTRFATLQSVDILILRCRCQVCTILYAFHRNQVQGVGFDTLRPRQSGHHFSDDTFKCIFLNENNEFCLIFLWSLFLRCELTVFHHELICRDTQGPATILAGLHILWRVSVCSCGYFVWSNPIWIIPVALFQHGLTLTPAWMSNYIHYKVCDKITYQFLNFNGTTDTLDKI